MLLPKGCANRKLESRAEAKLESNYSDVECGHPKQQLAAPAGASSGRHFYNFPLQLSQKPLTYLQEEMGLD